jgi:hypothetical protein
MRAGFTGLLLFAKVMLRTDMRRGKDEKKSGLSKDLGYPILRMVIMPYHPRSA